jgi:DNA-binding transcriptional LysR family regulator
MIELRQFKHSAALARFRNFRLAAESVYISQPALSLSIKAAEESLGQKLFVRTNKAIYPTVYGEIVIALAEKVVADVENMHREVDLLSGIEAGVLRICLSPYIHYSMAGRLIGEFLTDFPGVTLDILEGTWETRVEMLKRKQTDLVVEAYAVDPARKIFREPDITCIDLYIPPIVYYCRSGHPMAGPARVSYADLTRYPWAGEGGPPYYLTWLAEAAGLSSLREIPDRRQRFYSSDYHAIVAAVLNSDMISAGTPVFLDQYAREGSIRYLDIDWKIPKLENKGSILVLKNRTQSNVMKGTISMVKRILAEMAGKTAAGTKGRSH